jgi:aryl-alcohol dehydrogenase-like predicted oxidoreductase
VAHLGRTGIDEYTAAVLRFPGDIVAEVSTGIGLNMHEAQTVEVFGTEGRIFVGDPWCPSRWNLNPLRILLKRHDETMPREILVDCPRDLYTCEADMVAGHIAARQAPAMTWDDTIGNMETLDRWRQEVGLVYDQERPERVTCTISRRPLRRRADAPMKYGRIPGLDKPVARLIQGADQNHTMPFTAIQFDEYYACGGNAFDTSHGYGNPNGACERNLGQWIRNRAIRDEVVIIEKGANPPCGTPEGVTRELLSGLERLQVDRVDIWMMHRDNPEVPAGEFIDVLNEHRAAGRCTLFGVSNWSLERLQEAQAYAARHGKAFFSVLSNQFSLSEMIGNPWPEVLCLSAKGPAFQRWLCQTQMPLLPWSSQARGFFTDRAGRDRHDDPEIVRCWYSDANFRRRDRAFELAARRKVEPISIALAWVLHQPFPVFPMIGPRRHRELWSCLRALSIALTPEEMQWLDEGGLAQGLDQVHCR